MKKAEIQLRNTLKINASFSLLTGIVLLLFSQSMVDFMNLGPSLIYTVIGIGLIIFVVYLSFASMKKKINKWVIQSIIVQDFLWVIGSIYIILFNPYPITMAGSISIVIIALIVMTFALFQRKYLSML